VLSFVWMWICCISIFIEPLAMRTVLNKHDLYGHMWEEGRARARMLGKRATVSARFVKATRFNIDRSYCVDRP